MYLKGGVVRYKYLEMWKMERLAFVFVGFIAGFVNLVATDLWWENGKTYYRFCTFKEGIYRIPYSTLQSLGLNVASIDASRYAIFYLGKRLRIYVGSDSAERVGPLQPGDYIEFFAPLENWLVDTIFYRSLAEKPNRVINLYNDTACFYLAVLDQPDTTPRLSNVLTFTGVPHPPYEPYVYVEQKLERRIRYGRGEYVPAGAYRLWSSEFTSAEGWYLVIFQNQNGAYAWQTNIATPNLYSGTLKAFIRVILGGNSFYAHTCRIKLNGNVIADISYTGFEVKDTTIEVPASSLVGSGYNALRFEFNNAGYAGDGQGVAHVTIKYPRDLEKFPAFARVILDSQVVSVPRFLRIRFNSAPYITPVVHDLEEGRRVVGVDSAGYYIFGLPGGSSSGMREVVIGVPELLTPDKFVPVQFPDWLVNGPVYDYFVISVPALINASSQPLQRLVSHRSSPAGGNFRAKIVDVNLLYDAYSWGIRNHPLAIMRFIWHQARRLKQVGHTRRLHVLLVGRAYPLSDWNWKNSEVPVFGDPPSDMMLATHPDSSCSICPVAAVGRLVPDNEQELSNYVDKVISHEALLINEMGIARGWWKNVIHMGGGRSSAEQSVIRNLLESLERIIEKPAFGGSVHAFYKTSPDPIQILDVAKFDSLIEAGVSIQTFIGHSSANSFDVYIDQPENYPNRGKFPIVVSGGCYAASIHVAYETISKRFLYTQDKGAVGFYGSPYLAFLFPQYAIIKSFYESLADSPWLSVGEHWLKAFIDISSIAPYQSLQRQHLTTWVLHGDPGHILSLSTLPDYVVDERGSFIQQEDLTVYSDSIRMYIVVWNTGIAVMDSFDINITHRLPNGNSSVYVYRVPAPAYADTFLIVIPGGGLASRGLNIFSIFVDASDEIAEYDDYVNNRLQIYRFIGANVLSAVYPYPNSVVDTAPVTLYVFTGSVFSPPQDYVVEIDTSPYFNSPLYRSTVLNGVYGLIKWTPPTEWLPGVTYFWRVRASEDTTWLNMVFTYSGEKGYTGWHQHHPAHVKLVSKFTGLDIRPEVPPYYFFKSGPRKISVISANYPEHGNVNTTFTIPLFAVDGIVMDNGGCARWIGSCFGWSQYNGLGGIQVFLIDTATGMVFESSSAGLFGPFGEYHCCPASSSDDAGLDFGDVWLVRSGSTFVIDTPLSQTHQQNLADFLNALPPRYYLGIYAIGGWYAPKPSMWIPALKDAFRNLGFDKVDSLCDGCPFIFFTRLGVPSFTPVQLYSTDKSTILSWDTLITGRWTSGVIEPPEVGPAGRWHRLRIQVANAGGSGDSTWIVIYGIDDNNVETPLLVVNGRSELDTSLSWLPARRYPRLRFRAHFMDTINATPQPLLLWEVIYDPYPEFVFNPMQGLRMPPDTIYMGQTLEFMIAVENASDYFTDSLWVLCQVLKDGEVIDRFTVKLPPFKPKEIKELKVQWKSVPGVWGRMNLLVQLNPYLEEAGGFAQPEMYTFNNVIVVPFYVRPDVYNPFVDVTFDGRRIFDGDYVSPRPEIVVTLKDDNPYLLLDDTSLFQIYFKYPDGKLRRVVFQDTAVTFIPARNTYNEAKVILRPVFRESGLYTLIVQGVDKAGNQAGKYDYRVSFRVEYRPMITNVFNYPNPFSTSTRFVFTITGERPPDDLRIQIMTIDGRIVREITLEELGPIHIGTNITSFAWDGTDQWGQPLGNGVYFYRVIAKLEGESMDKLRTPADKYFQSGIGKMYIVR